jgi:elongation factor P
MIESNNLRNGTCFTYDNRLWKCLDSQHVKPGKGPAFVRTRIMDLDTGSIVDKTFRAGEKIQDIRVERRPCTFSYVDGDNYVFMDSETFEQYMVPTSFVGDDADFLIEECPVDVSLHEERVLSVELPASYTYEVVETDPGERGDTSSGGTKPAKLNSGGTVQVPLFIKIGERIVVDPRAKRYIGRDKG